MIIVTLAVVRTTAAGTHPALLADALTLDLLLTVTASAAGD